MQHAVASRCGSCRRRAECGQSRRIAVSHFDPGVTAMARQKCRVGSLCLSSLVGGRTCHWRADGRKGRLRRGQQAAPLFSAGEKGPARFAGGRNSERGKAAAFLQAWKGDRQREQQTSGRAPSCRWCSCRAKPSSSTEAKIGPSLAASGPSYRLPIPSCRTAGPSSFGPIRCRPMRCCSTR